MNGNSARSTHSENFHIKQFDVFLNVNVMFCFKCDIIKMVEFLVVSMGTNCAHFLANICLYSYEAEYQLFIKTKIRN